MSKRTSYEIKKEILRCVREKPASYAELERKVNTGFRSIKQNCDELALFEQVKVTQLKKSAANGRPYSLVSITKEGLKHLKNS